MSTPGNLELAPGVWAAQADVRFAFSRSGGPGGQNVNKVNTKAELRVRPEALQGLTQRALARLRELAGNRLTNDGELLIVADDERTQERNRAGCMQRLRVLIVAAQKEPKVRRKTKPTRGSRERRLEAKHARGQLKRERQRWSG